MKTKTFEIDNYILVNFPKDGSFDKALDLGKEYEKVGNDELLSFAEKYPDLRSRIGVDYMFTVATKDITFDGYRQACYVWWNDSRREADLLYVGYFDDAYDWFVFRKKSTLKSDTQPSFEPLILELAIERVKEAGYESKKKSWYITGRGQVTDTRSDKVRERQAFLGAYESEEAARQARDQIKIRYGTK